MLKRTGVDANEGQGAEAVVHDLERECAKRTIGIDDGEGTGLFAFEVDLGLRVHLGGRGEVVHDGVEDLLDALVLERRAAEGREEARAGALADAALEVSM